MSPTSFQLLHPASCSNMITVYENFVNSAPGFFQIFNRFSIVVPSIIFAARTRGFLRAPSRRFFFQHFRVFAPLKIVPLRELIFRKRAQAIFIFFLQIFNSVCHYFPPTSFLYSGFIGGLTSISIECARNPVFLRSKKMFNNS